MKPTAHQAHGAAKGELDGAQKLKETIAALERGDFSSQHPHGLATDTSIPFGIAYQVAVQREASRVLLPGSTPPGRKAMAAGRHPGPVSMLTHRQLPTSLNAPPSAPGPDPFSRTAAGLSNPQELSWRAAVAATTPAARRADTSTLQPVTVITPEPFSAALEQVHHQQVSQQAWGSQREGDVSSKELPDAWGSGVASPADTHNQSPARGVLHDGDSQGLTGAGSLGAALSLAAAQHTKQRLPRHPPGKLLPPPGWGANAGHLLGGTPPQAEAPEVFWRTVAPDVHHEMLDYMFEQGYDQSTTLRSMLAAVRAQQAGMLPWGSLPPGAGGAGAAGIPGAHAPGQQPHGGTTSPAPALDKSETRAQLAAMAAGLAAQTGAFATVNRGPGAPAQSRWYLPDGRWQWRPCTVVAAAPDMSSFVVRWEHAGGVKTVSRFNILFPGETEEALSLLKQAALSHQRKLRELSSHKAQMEGLPHSDAPPMPPTMLASIVQRVGGSHSLRPSLTHPSSLTTGHSTQGSLVATGSASTFHDMSQKANPASVPDLFLKLNHLSMMSHYGLAPGIRLNALEAAAARAAKGGNAAAIAAALTQGSQETLAQLAQLFTTHGVEAVLGDITSWRLGTDEGWHRFTHHEAAHLLALAVQDAAREYEAAHNKMAYRAAFARETGLQVPENLDEMVMALGEDESQEAAAARQAAEQQRSQRSQRSQQGAASSLSPPSTPRHPGPLRPASESSPWRGTNSPRPTVNLGQYQRYMYPPRRPAPEHGTVQIMPGPQATPSTATDSSIRAATASTSALGVSARSGTDFASRPTDTPGGKSQQDAASGQPANGMLSSSQPGASVREEAVDPPTAEQQTGDGAGVLPEDVPPMTAEELELAMNTDAGNPLLAAAVAARAVQLGAGAPSSSHSIGHTMSHARGHSWRSHMSSSSMAARAEIAALAEAVVAAADAGLQRPPSSSRPLSGGATGRPGSAGGVAAAAAGSQPHGVAGATDDEHEGGDHPHAEEPPPASGVTQEASNITGDPAAGEFSELSLRDVIAPSEESSAASKVTLAGGVPAVVPLLKLGTTQDGEQQGRVAGDAGAQPVSGSSGRKHQHQQKPRTRRTRTAYYDRAVFAQRLTRIRATALVADAALLGAWQQSIRYLFDVQIRDIFGLNYLPLKEVYRTEPNPLAATQWKRYLESRKAPPEGTALPTGPSSSSAVKVHLPTPTLSTNPSGIPFEGSTANPGSTPASPLRHKPSGILKLHTSGGVGSLQSGHGGGGSAGQSGPGGIVPPLVGTPASGAVFNSPQGVTPRFGVAKASAHQGISIVAFLNVLEGALHGELEDLKRRVVSQLALIVADAAQEAFESSIAGWDAPPSPPAQLLKYGNFAALDPAVKAAQARQAAISAQGKKVDVHFDQRDYYRLASLLNVALYNTLYGWVIENIQAYVAGVALYAAPSYTGPALFSVTLEASGDDIKYYPSLDSVEQRLVESILEAVKGVNALPGLRVVSRTETQGLVSNPYAMPFDIAPDLPLPPVVPPDDPHLQAELATVKAAVASCVLRCEQLMAAFRAHMGLLGLDARGLKERMVSAREVMQADDWATVISKYKNQWEEIVGTLPVAADVGLFLVDCRALQRRLAERAERLALTVLLTLQEDADTTSAAIVARLQPLLDTLTQPLTDLSSVHVVKEAAQGAGAAVNELWRQGQQLRMARDVMEMFKHEVPDELVLRIYKALQLPTLVQEAVSVLNASMASYEDTFLHRLRKDREEFAGVIVDMAQTIQEWGSRFQEELVDEYLAEGSAQLERLKSMVEKAESINRQETLAGWETTPYASVHQLRRQLMPYTELWRLVRNFKDNYQQWMYGPLFAFDMEACETSVPAWTRLAARLAKDLKGAPQSIAAKYSSYLIDFESHLPLLRALRTQGLRQRHWARIHAEVPALETLDRSQLTLHTMLQAGMHRHVGVLKELADLAARELVIEQAVSTISTAFMGLTITFTEEKDSGIPDIWVLTNGNDLLKFMDDAQLRIKGLSTSVYVDPHKESVIQWDEALSSVRNVLEGWLEVQARWGHLAPLFGPSGLSSQLPLEARRFTEVTREWRRAIATARAHCEVSELLRHSELPGLLLELSRGLESVHKGVMEFLEEKRANFPRFYFLSNNEMVNVLVRSHDPVAVEPYMGRCFPGIGRLGLSREWGVRIESLISPEGEHLLLRNPVDLVDYGTQKGIDVEVWMMSLEKQMRIAMRETLRSALEALGAQPYDQWLLAWPAQAVLLTGALTWCREVTDALERGPLHTTPLPKLEAALATQLLHVVGVIQHIRLTPLQRSVLENIIIAKVYHRDVLVRLSEGRVESSEDIEWLRVLRFYQEGEVVVRVGYSQISYGQEYLGNSPRLVITPLTERAFSSLVTAVHLHYGGAPEGPAGTGKTETVKELSRCVAKQCIVFNTTEQLDVSHMTRLLMGIASTGAWSCFDEFNRMDMEVLSVVAKQIMTIQAALAAGERWFIFEGRNLGINSSLAIFITMNPMYEFRNVLPSNLKALFRPVAMMIPDYRLIAEVQLYAAGFQTAGALAAHLVSVLKIASHRLSNQAHYDFAMRTLKSVLLIAAQLRTAEAGVALAPDQEASLVRVALLRCNMSKLRAMDAQIFMSVVDREFPQPGTADQYMGDLKQHVRTAFAREKMHATDDMVMRCLQTHSMLQIRTGVMLLGPAACGKSAVIRALAGALSLLDEQQRGAPPVSVAYVFPKAVAPARLYGLYNASTQTWEDGVLTTALRAANARDATNRAWIVLDGPVDHVWVEALNPVLDDNRTLCLSSGETIPLREGVNLVMEVDSIAMASPATVSRCGMVYMSPPAPELWKHLIKGWVAQTVDKTLDEYRNKIEVTVIALFTELAKAYVDSLEPDSMAPRQQPTGVLASLLRLLEALLPLVGQKVHRGMLGKDAAACIEAAVLTAVVWAFEACLPVKARAFFNILVRQMCARTLKYTVTKDTVTTEHASMGFHVPMPPDGQVFDFLFDFDAIRWVSWKEHVDTLLDPTRAAAMGPNAFAPFGVPALLGQLPSTSPARDFVFTADNLPALYLMRLLLTNRSNILLIGPTGTGKSVLVNALLGSADDWMPAAEALRNGSADEDGSQSVFGSTKHTVQGEPSNGGSEAQASPGRTSGNALDAASMAGMAGSFGSPRGHAGGGLERSTSTLLPPGAATQGLDDGSGRKASPFATMSLTLSSQSTATNTRTTIETYLVKRRRNVLGPPVGKVAVMFVDDISSAGRDKFGSQSALELLRQWCAAGGWHDDLSGAFKNVVDAQLVGAATATPFSKPVSDRLLQYVTLVAMPPISHAGFSLIFTSVLKRHMASMSSLPSGLLPALVSATMDVYRHVTATLLPVPSRPHYLFSIRHVGAVFKSMFHAHRSSRSTPLQLVRLWQHECARVFQDRIFDMPTREWFDKTLAEVSAHHLAKYAPSAVEPAGTNVVFVTFASHGGNYYELAEHVLQPDRALSAETNPTAGSALSTPQATPRGVALLNAHKASMAGGRSSPNSSANSTPRVSPTRSPTRISMGGTASNDSAPPSRNGARASEDGRASGNKGRPGRAPSHLRLNLNNGSQSCDIKGRHSISGAGSTTPPTGGSPKASEAAAAAVAGHLAPTGSAGPTPPSNPLLSPHSPISPGLGPAPESALMKLYMLGWVDDGTSSREEAVESRLTAIASQHAQDFLAAHSTSSGAKGGAGGKDGRKESEGPTSVLGGGIVDSHSGLVVHRTALMHLARISRVMSMEQGHLILVGPPGSGRRTLARLACHISKVTPFEANLKDAQKGFNWKDMLKHVMHTAGVLGRPTCLLLVDISRSAETMLDDVSHLMAAGHLPGLFKNEEVQTIIKSLKPVARAAGIQWSEIDRTGASDAVLQRFFIDRCRTNLHIMLVLEQHEASLQRLIVAFPKMFHLAAMDVVDEWDRDARTKIAHSVLESPATLRLDPGVYDQTIEACWEMHDVAKQVCSEYNNRVGGGKNAVWVTACQYLQLLNAIKQQLPRKRASLADDKDKYLEGVAKMTDMTARLKRLQDEIAALQPRLQERQIEASQLMSMIQEERGEAESALGAILPEEEQARLAAEKKATLVADCEAELARVMPPLLKAMRDLKAIDKNSIAELKVMKSPPIGVKIVMRAICIMLGCVPPLVLAGKVKDEEEIKKAWWEESIRVLGDFHFLEYLLGYDKDAMTPDMVAQVAQFVHDPQFDPTIVARSSISAAALAKWVIAMDDYQRVKKVVDPKREALRLAESELASQEARLAEARKRLAAINDHIKVLEARYLEANSAKEALSADIEAAQRRVGQAQKVLNAVRKEVDRWKRNAEASDLKHKQVLGEALLGSGYIAYLGPVPGSYRLQAEAGWTTVLDKAGIMPAPGFSLAESMGDPMQLEHWRDAGLPQSRTAVENALVMAHAPQWSLLIDPQELGNAFLRGYYGGENAPITATTPLARGQAFMTLDPSDPGFRETMLRAIETGAVLLLENLDEDMDDMIEQVLQQSTFHNQRGELCIKLGESSALYNPRFRMFVTTRLRTPRFSFNVVRHMVVVNFSITRAQLGELLITATLRHEMPELEAEHGSLIKQRAKNASEIASLEEQVLRAINTTRVEALLEESDVYNMLVALQDSATAIKSKVHRIEESQKRISDVRATIDKYFVSRAAVMFFVLQDMALVRHSYQFSLKWFTALFKESLASCPRSNTGKERLESLTLHFAGMLYTGAARSLFDEDKLPFAVLMLARYMLASKLATKEEVNLLLFGRSEQGKPSLAKLADGRPDNKRLQAATPRGSTGAPSFRTRDTSTTGGAAAAGGGSSNPAPGGSPRSTGSSPKASTSGAAAPAASGGGAFDGLFKGSGGGRGGAGGGAMNQSRHRLSRLGTLTQASTSGSGNGVEGSRGPDPQGLPQLQEGRDEGGEGAQQAVPRVSAGEEEADVAMVAVVGTARVTPSPIADGAATPEFVRPPQQSSGGQPQLVAAGTIPDFLEMSAPAVMPDSMRPDWLGEDAWGRLRDLGKFWPYNKLMPVVFGPDAVDELHRYHQQLAEVGIEGAEPPHPRVAQLTPFQQLLLVRCMQPRAFLSAATFAVHHYLGPACVVAEPVDLESAFPMTSSGTPIVLISSSDQPLPQLMLFAEQRNSKVVHMAIGRGQGAAADKVIRASISHPLWVVLENTHLAGDWMPALCSLVQALPSMKPHWDFRLWLTTVPTQDFPAVILQTSLKLVMDPPTGLKANLASVMGSLPSDVTTGGRHLGMPRVPDAVLPPGSGRASADPAGGRGRTSVSPVDREVLNPREPVIMGPAWKALILRLCMFHALLLERHHYGGLGWRRSYDFSAADFLSTIKQVVQVHRELTAHLSGGLNAEADLELVNRALPGLLYVDGQCLYGGKVTQDWDRRLLVVLLQAQLMPGSNASGPPHAPPSVPTAASLLPDRVTEGNMDLQVVAKEVRQAHISSDDPGLVGLTSGAAVVRRSQQTRHALHILQRVQLMQGAADSESDAAKPLQVALGVAQDVSRQLPFTVLPTVLTAWVALVQGKNNGPLAGGGARPAPGGTAGAGAAAAAGGGAPAAGGGGAAAAGNQATTAAAAAAAAGRLRPVNRARQLKMTEVMSPAAADRWAALGEYERKMMVQVFDAEVACYQCLLTAVHSSIKLVTSAIKGFEPVTGEFQELVRQLSSNEVPRAWAEAGPGGVPVELAADSIASWVSDLLARLEWIYGWAVEGPPVVVPLGMLARPKAFLTAIQQIHAERLDCAVGSLQFEVHIMLEGGEEVAQEAAQLTTAEMDVTLLHSSQGGYVSLLNATKAGVLISGVTLQGAIWDQANGCLDEPGPDQIYCPMPVLWLVPVVELEAGGGAAAGSKARHQGASPTKGEAASSAAVTGGGASGSQGGSVSAGVPPLAGVGLGGIRTLSGRSQASQAGEGGPLSARQMAAASLLPPPPPPAGGTLSSQSSASQQILASMGPAGSFNGVMSTGGGPRMSIGGQSQGDRPPARGGSVLGNIMAQSGGNGSLRRSMIGQNPVGAASRHDPASFLGAEPLRAPGSSGTLPAARLFISRTQHLLTHSDEDEDALSWAAPGLSSSGAMARRVPGSSGPSSSEQQQQAATVGGLPASSHGAGTPEPSQSAPPGGGPGSLLPLPTLAHQHTRLAHPQQQQQQLQLLPPSSSFRAFAYASSFRAPAFGGFGATSMHPHARGGPSTDAGANIHYGSSGGGADGRECYVCPVYLHSHAFDLGLGSASDVDDCLFDLLLPPGRYTPQHWVTRNVVMLVTSDPAQLAGMQTGTVQGGGVTPRKMTPPSLMTPVQQAGGTGGTGGGATIGGNMGATGVGAAGEAQG